jgi:hypothetical protein
MQASQNHQQGKKIAQAEESTYLEYPVPALFSLTAMILQIFNCAPISTSIDKRITKPNSPGSFKETVVV